MPPSKKKKKPINVPHKMKLYKIPDISHTVTTDLVLNFHGNRIIIMSRTCSANIARPSRERLP